MTKLDEVTAEGEFFKIIEAHEQRILDYISQSSAETHFIRCSDCGTSCEVPFYRQQTKCAQCRPPEITLEATNLDVLIQESREDLFEELSELDTEFSSQNNIKLRDTLLAELTEASLLAEASATAVEALLDRVDPDSFDQNEFENLIKDLLRIRLASRFAKIFEIPEEASQELVKQKIDSLFVKRKKFAQVGSKK